MSLLEPTLAEPATPDDWQRQAAERVTPYGSYLGAHAVGAVMGSVPGMLYTAATTPGRLHGDLSTVIGGATDEFGRQAPGLQDLSGVPSAPPMPKDAYEASPNYRPGVPWDEGMTEARAAALAADHDRRAWRESLIARSDAGAVGQAGAAAVEIGVGALDPTNYIPLLGQASKAAMLARFGRIGGALAVHGVEAALNTGLFEPLRMEQARAQGQDYGWEDAAADILKGGIGGALLGTAVGEGLRYLGFGRGAAERPQDVVTTAPQEAARPDVVPTTAPQAAPEGVSIAAQPGEVGAGVIPRRPGTDLFRVDDMLKAADATSLAADQMERGEPVDVAPLLANDPAYQRPRPAPAIQRYDTRPMADLYGLTDDLERGLAEGKTPERMAEELGAAGRLAQADEGARVSGRDPAAARAEFVRMLVDDMAASRAAEDATARDTSANAFPAGETGGAAPAAGAVTDDEARQLLAEEQMLASGPGRRSEATRARLAEIMRALPADGEQRARLQGEHAATVAAGRVATIKGQRKGRIQGARGALPGDVGGGSPPSFATATPEPPHPTLAEAAQRAGTNAPAPDTLTKDAGLEGFKQPLPGHEPKPEPGTPEAERAAKPQPEPTPREKAAAHAALPPELQEIEAMRREGTFGPEHEAILAAGEREAQQAEARAMAFQTLAGCVLRNVV